MKTEMEKSWKVTCTPDQFRTIRENSQFKKVLTLSRVLNAMLAAQGAVAHIDAKMDTTEAFRQRLHFIQYLGALLYEALNFADSLRTEFHHSTVFEDGLGIILKDPDVRSLRNGVLKKLRNKVVFHFDQDVVYDSLKTLDQSAYVFITGSGDLSKTIHYQLVDEATLHYLLDQQRNEGDSDERFTEVFTSVAKLSKRYQEAANGLISAVVKRHGFKYIEGEN